MGFYFDAGLVQSTTRTYAARIKKHLTLFKELATHNSYAYFRTICRFVFISRVKYIS